MAAVSLFWDTNMAALTSCENTAENFFSLYLVILFYFCDFELIIWNPKSAKFLLMESRIGA